LNADTSLILNQAFLAARGSYREELQWSVKSDCLEKLDAMYISKYDTLAAVFARQVRLADWRRCKLRVWRLTTPRPGFNVTSGKVRRLRQASIDTKEQNTKKPWGLNGQVFALGWRHCMNVEHTADCIFHPSIFSQWTRMLLEVSRERE
jgi:hypothetical protein